MSGKVLVAGGGPGGSVAALLLASQERDIVVLEQRSVNDGAGAGILLQPNGLAVLDAMGLGDALRAGGAELRSVSLYDDAGRVLMRTPVPDFGCGLDHALVVRRQTLATVLQQTMSASEAIQLRYGATVASADESGLVTYRTDGVEHRTTASLVIGADGIGSRVRRTGNFGARPVRPGHWYARTIIRGGFGLPAGECWSRLGLVGWAPVGDGDTYMYASVGDATVRAALAAEDLEGLVAAWREAVPFASDMLERIESIDDLLVNEAATVKCDTFVDGPRVLIGDAAHSMAPNLGQGANSALIDAAVLVSKLSTQPDAPALRAYDASRRPAVARVQRNAQRLARLGHLRSRSALKLRNRVLRALSRPSLLERQARAAQQIDPLTTRDFVRDLLT